MRYVVATILTLTAHSIFVLVEAANLHLQSTASGTRAVRPIHAAIHASVEIRRLSKELENLNKELDHLGYPGRMLKGRMPEIERGRVVEKVATASRLRSEIRQLSRLRNLGQAGM